MRKNYDKSTNTYTVKNHPLYQYLWEHDFHDKYISKCGGAKWYIFDYTQELEQALMDWDNLSPEERSKYKNRKARLQSYALVTH